MRKVLVVLIGLALLSLAMYGLASAQVLPYGAVTTTTLATSDTTVVPGQTITCSASGFAPNEKYSVLWDGVVIVDPFTDASGVATFSFTIPLDASAGLHTLSAVGPGAGGGTLIASVTIRVTGVTAAVPPTRAEIFPITGGLPLWILLIAGLVSVVGGFGLKLRARS